MRSRLYGLFFAIAALFANGCSKGPKYVQEFSVYPVSGVVQVDGEPAEFVWIKIVPVAGTSELKAPVTTVTNSEGQFHFTTYVATDGLPKGEYIMTFKWETLGLGGSNDRLNGKYSNPAKSNNKIKIEEGDVNDLGTISLSSK